MGAIYPARPVRLIVPFAPGGPNDLAARVIAQGLSDRLGKQFYVENIAGRAATSARSRRPARHPTATRLCSWRRAMPPIQPVREGRLRSTQELRCGHDGGDCADHPHGASIDWARTVKELIGLIKAHPGKYSYASPGAGTPPHLLGELFRLSLQLDLVHVPFSSGGTAIGSTVAGHTPISFGALPPAVQHVKDGKLRAVALTSRRIRKCCRVCRRSRKPDIPTSPPTSGPQYWCRPARRRTLSRCSRPKSPKVIGLPDVRERMAALGYQPVGNTPEDCAAQIAIEITSGRK